MQLSPMTLVTYLVRLMTVLLVFPLHEYAHAWTAYKLGDDTPEREGRLTLDPMTHLDGLGALLTMAFGFGWGQPVEFKPSRFRHPRIGMLLTSAAGPAVNFLAAVLAVVAYRLVGCSAYIDPLTYATNADLSTGYYLAYMLYEFISVNLLLWLFNLIPVFPLDGARALTYFLPPKASLWMMKNQRFFHNTFVRLIAIGMLALPVMLLRRLMMMALFWITAPLMPVITV